MDNVSAKLYVNETFLSSRSVKVEKIDEDMSPQISDIQFWLWLVLIDLFFLEGQSRVKIIKMEGVKKLEKGEMIQNAKKNGPQNSNTVVPATFFEVTCY